MQIYPEGFVLVSKGGCYRNHRNPSRSATALLPWFLLPCRLLTYQMGNSINLHYISIIGSKLNIFKHHSKNSTLSLVSHSQRLRYRGVRLNAKQYPPLYQFYVTADFRDYTARISADKRGRTLYGPPRHKTHLPLYKTYPR